MESLFTLEDRPGFRAIGRHRRIDKAKEHARADAEAFFAEAQADGLFAQIAPLGAVEPLGILGIFDSRNRGNSCGFDLWIAVASEAEVPDDLESIDIPEATYLTFTAIGPFPEVMAEMEKIADEQLHRFPPSHAGALEIEIYPFACEENDNAECGLWVSLTH